MTREEALKIAMRSAEGAGVDTKKIPIDENYVKAIQEGTLKQYGDSAIAQGKSNREQGLDTVAVVNGRNISRKERDESKGFTSKSNTGSGLSSKGSDISNQYKSTVDALTNALKQRISESVNAQKGLISQASQQYDPLRAQSELSKEQQLRSTMERASLMGDRGGVGRMETLGVQTAGENRLQDINLQQQNFINQANAEIERLNNEGKFQEAQIIAEQRQRELQDLLAERARQESLQRSDFGSAIGANYADLQAFANQLRAQGAPEWQINQVLAYRQGKIQEQGLDQMGRPIQQQVQGVQLTQPTAMSLWKQLGTANEAIAMALGIPVGTRYSSGSTSSKSTSTKTTSTGTDYNSKLDDY